MIPQVQDDIRQDFTFEALPSKTFRLNHNNLTVTGTIDQIQAVEGRFPDSERGTLPMVDLLLELWG